MTDMVNHPPHYQAICHCSACKMPVEAIQITEKHDFRLGNALKYILRSGKKGSPVEDLKKRAGIWIARLPPASLRQGERHDRPQAQTQPPREHKTKSEPPTDRERAKRAARAAVNREFVRIVRDHNKGIRETEE